MAYEIHGEPDNDVATRTGEFALLIYSIGGVPFFTQFGRFADEYL